MGRETKRVPLDFDWPLNVEWKGYINGFAGAAIQCSLCHGSGCTAAVQRLHDQWYGTAPFNPASRGSKPWQPTDPPIWAFAKRNQESAPGFFGGVRGAVLREVVRAARAWRQKNRC